MLRRRLPYFFVLLFSMPVLAQDCPSNNVFINTQLQADNFLANFPLCEHLPGNLFIQGSVTDLSPFGNLKSVAGNVTISATTDLTSLAGLGGLTTIGGDLTIGNNAFLPSLQGLDGLVSVGEDIWIAQSNIPSLAGLESLTTVSGQINVQNAHQLQSMTGLDNLIEVGGDLSLRWMDGLQSLAGLQNLTTVGGNFIVSDAASVSSVENMNSLVSVGGSFTISNCPALSSVNSFNALESVGAWFSVGGDLMTQINGFESLTRVDSSIFIGGDALTSLTALSNLQMAGGISIDGPFTSLDLSALQVITKYDLDIEAFDLTELIGCEQLTSVGGDMILTTGMRNLPDFPKLKSIGRMLLIHSRASLEVLDGFNQLESIGSGQLGWGLDIYEHDNLTTISGFQKLSNIAGDFLISNCDLLTTVTAFESLSVVGGSFTVTQNASLTDCSPFCPFLREGTAASKAVKWNGGDNSSPCWDQDDVDFACTFDLRLVDLNPLDFPDGIGKETDVRQLDVEELANFDTLRQAICADGVTEVLLRIEVPEDGQFELMEMPERIETPWGTDVYEEEEDRFFIYMLYTAPEEFDPGDGGTGRYMDTVLSYKEPVLLDFINNDEERFSYTASVTVVRPPVVLVHGTFDNPMEAWDTKVTDLPESETLLRRLQREGYFTTAVDYESTNGDSDGSSFEDNKMVVFENEGGIRDAIEYYRHNLEVAATQADVVGHSMGGVLARVYASTYYNPDDYERQDNFMEGDINRFITIAATHLGSHLGELRLELEDAEIPLTDLTSWLVNFAGHVILTYFTGSPATDAVRDQQPKPYGGEALDLIGATPIPSHAISASVPPFGLKDPVFDPMEEYYDLYWYTELLMYYNAAVLDQYLAKKHDLFEMGYAVTTTWDGSQSSYFQREIADIIVFSDMIDNAIQSAGKLLSVLDGSYEPPSGAQLFKWAYNELGMSDLVDIDPFIFLYEAYTNPLGVISGYVVDQIMPTEAEIREAQESLHEKSIEGLRSLIFNNDANDGVVSVTSQRGLIDQGVDGCTDCVSHFDNVLHGFAPRYPDLQARVIELLDGGMDQFNENGFPDPSEVMPLYYPPNELDLHDGTLRGDDAICQSGMVPSHARAYARVADRENTVIIVRPVNPDATPVIAAGAATKVMNVKPKSSNWGPQRGYLPADQRYSKIWKLFEEPTRSERITQYNMKVMENLDPSDPLVSKKQLNIKACNTRFWVYLDNNKYEGENDMCAEDEIVLVPVQNPDLVCFWGGDDPCSGLNDFYPDDNITSTCIPIGPEHDLAPFEVIATIPTDSTNPQSSSFITADYDLLMIGFFEGEGLTYSEPAEVPFRDDVGQLTSRQETLIDKLNAEAGHSGGNLTHHGPENQFNLSPYIDYPLTVFAPDNTPGSSGGEILSIDMGDEGFRDINLKKYINKMRRKGYDLYDNPRAPGWRWEWNEGQKGFILEDHKDLADYVEQMPLRTCNKVGNPQPSICDVLLLPNATSNTSQESWLQSSTAPMAVLPNPVYGDILTVVVKSEQAEAITLLITDAYGYQRVSQEFATAGGRSEVEMRIDHLEPGIYTVTTAPHGRSVRFVKM